MRTITENKMCHNFVAEIYIHTFLELFSSGLTALPPKVKDHLPKTPEPAMRSPPLSYWPEMPSTQPPDHPWSPSAGVKVKSRLPTKILGNSVGCTYALAKLPD